MVAGRSACGELPLRQRDAHRIVVDPPAAAAQHDVRVRIAARAKHRRLSLLRDAEKMMRVPAPIAAR